MTSWVALLRGVNVGGITIKSADLRALLSELGLEEVKTYLASGNASFTSARSHADLVSSIQTALGERFGYEAWIILVTREDLAAAITGFPFDADDATRQPYAIFCVDPKTRDELTDAAAAVGSDVDPVAAGEGVVYWAPPKGLSTDTPFSKIVGKPTYKSRTTTRNLRTLQKIVAGSP